MIIPLRCFSYMTSSCVYSEPPPDVCELQSTTEKTDNSNLYTVTVDLGHFEPRTKMFVITRIRESDVLLGARHTGYETVCVC